MAFVSSMNIVGSEAGGAYRRKMVVFMSESDRDDFRMAMAKAMESSNRGAEKAGGVRVTEIVEDETELPLTYDPTHPDAAELGYVEMPNVILVKEITDAMAASQAYSANVTAFNVLKGVLSSSLEIGR